jgi:hypothetical protein
LCAADSCGEFVLTCGGGAGHLPAETACTSTSFTIFEATSEIQRMIIGRAAQLAAGSVLACVVNNRPAAAALRPDATAGLWQPSWPPPWARAC